MKEYMVDVIVEHTIFVDANNKKEAEDKASEIYYEGVDSDYIEFKVTEV